MEEKLREKYEKFIKDGGFYICSLLVERKPAESEDPVNGTISFEELMELHDGDSDPLWKKKLWEEFTCSEEISIFYDSLVEAVQYLDMLDLSKAGIKRTEHQHLYPSLLLETYGKGQRPSQVFPNEDKAGTVTPNYVRIRKKGLSLLLDEVLKKNNEENYVDYDFESDEAKAIIEEVLTKVEASHDEKVLLKTRSMFRRIRSQSMAGVIEDSSRTLIDSVEENPVDINMLRSLETKIETVKIKGREYCEIKADSIRGVNTYILFFDERAEDVGPEPCFTKKYLETDGKGKEYRRRYVKEDFEGHDVVICVGPEPKALKTKIFNEGGCAVVRAKKQDHCHSYTLRVDGVNIATRRNPVFRDLDNEYFEEGTFEGHNVVIVANRNIDDLYMIIERGRKFKLRNYLLDLTDEHNNSLNNSYKILLRAYGSLEVIRRISPDNYKKIIEALEKGKNSNRHLKDLWPLACILMF